MLHVNVLHGGALVIVTADTIGEDDVDLPVSLDKFVETVIVHDVCPFAAATPLLGSPFFFEHDDYDNIVAVYLVVQFGGPMTAVKRIREATGDLLAGWGIEHSVIKADDDDEDDVFEPFFAGLTKATGISAVI